MRFLLSKLRIFLFFPIPYLSQPLLCISSFSTLGYRYLFITHTGFFSLSLTWGTLHMQLYSCLPFLSSKNLHETIAFLF